MGPFSGLLGVYASLNNIALQGWSGVHGPLDSTDFGVINLVAWHQSIANHGTLLCAMIDLRVFPPRLAAYNFSLGTQRPPQGTNNLNSCETLSKVFFQINSHWQHSHQSGHVQTLVCMLHGAGFFSPSRNLGCLVTICQNWQGEDWWLTNWTHL